VPQPQRAAAGAALADVVFVGGWDPLNAWGRSALLARVAWCLAQAAPGPCNMSQTVRADGVQWALAGWFDEDAYARARDAGGGNATAAGWPGAVLLQRGCKGVGV